MSIPMVRIISGTYWMGSPKSEKGWNSDETLHQVTLTRDFRMGATKVTQGQWREVMGTSPSRFKGNDLPVEQVSWDEVLEFCNRLSSKEELGPAYRVSGAVVEWDRSSPGYRLPTEAEWEYACRAGTNTAYWSGSSEADLGRVGWYDGNSGGCSHPVAQKPANAWGLYDVHGNVWERCWDWFGEYPAGAVTDPVGSRSGSARVSRGGSWYNSAGSGRAANRNLWTPFSRGAYLGFRLARTH